MSAEEGSRRLVNQIYVPDEVAPAYLKLKAQIHREYMAQRDFCEAKDYLKSFTDSLQTIVKRSLLTSAVVTYIRPFSWHPENHDVADPNVAFPTTEMNEAEQALHAKIRTLRNKAVAHSDYDFRPVNHVDFEGLGFSFSAKTYEILGEGIEVSAFHNLSEKLERHFFDSVLALDKQLKSMAYYSVPNSVDPERNNP